MITTGLKIAHSADWHLGTAFGDFSGSVRDALQEEQRTLMEKLVQACRKREVDLLILAGDIFESTNPETIWIQRFVDFLNNMAPIPVFISPGNHDFYSPGSFWDKTEWPEHVHIFKKPETIELPGMSAAVSGVPFTSLMAREVLDTGSASGMQFPSEFYRILAIHGDLVSGQASDSRYNPIQLKDPAFDSFDYVALGHVHDSRDSRRDNMRRTVIRYPGCPQGRGFDELGPKGFWVEILNRHQDYQGRWITDHEDEFVPLHTRQFRIETLDAAGSADNTELLHLLEQKLAGWGEQMGENELNRALIRVRVTGRRARHLLIDTAMLRDWLAGRGVFFAEVRDETVPDWPLDELRAESGFFGIMLAQYDRQRAAIISSRMESQAKERELRNLETALVCALEASEASL